MQPVRGDGAEMSISAMSKTYDAPEGYTKLTEEQREIQVWRGLGCVMDGPHAGAWVPANNRMIVMPIIGSISAMEIGEADVPPKPTSPMEGVARYERVLRLDGQMYLYVQAKP